MPSQPNQQSDDERDRDDERRERDDEQSGRDAQAPEDRPDEPGAEGGADSPTRGKLPGMPEKDDPTPMGDTDQHSTS